MPAGQRRRGGAGTRFLIAGPGFPPGEPLIRRVRNTVNDAGARSPGLRSRPKRSSAMTASMRQTRRCRYFPVEDPVTLQRVLAAPRQQHAVAGGASSGCAPR